LSSPVQNGKNLTYLLPKTDKLSGNNRKINRAITERKFYACKIFYQLVENDVAQTPMVYAFK